MTLKDRVHVQLAQLEADKAVIDEKIALLNQLLDEDEAGEGDDDQGGDGEQAESAPRRNGKPKAEKKPRAPKAAKPSANGDGGDDQGNVDPRARGMIARLLFERGPMRSGDICSTLEIAQPTLAYHAKNSPYFRKQNPDNRLSPWELTEAGRAKYGDPASATRS